MTLNEILGEAACRKLTEFLGEDWHELPLEGCWRLDFSDPRVWTRLLTALPFSWELEKGPRGYNLAHEHDRGHVCWRKEPAEAVCRAVLAFIEEGEKP